MSLLAGTDDETLTLIRLRAENNHLFTSKSHTAKRAREEILQKKALAGVVSPTQVAKKWDNIKGVPHNWVRD